MNYIAYHFTVTPSDPGSEILMAMISDMGFESFDSHPDGFTAFIREEYEVQVQLQDLHFDEFTYQVKKEKVEQRNWNEEWEKNFDPVRVDELLLIRAPFHGFEIKYRYEIVIMPKMSFGTGHHQTTQLMCKEMFDLDMKEKRVLDMGCGTGILAILAEKLGAKEVLGVDIDEWSVENSVENVTMNRCTRVRILKGDANLLEKESEFDIIIANINKNILKSQIPVYGQRMKSGGNLLLSGFFTTDVAELTKVAGKYGFVFQHSRHSGEWAMMRLQRS